MDCPDAMRIDRGRGALKFFTTIFTFVGMNQTVELQIIDFLRARISELRGLWLFGSRADGTDRTDSDYDIAFLTEKPGYVSDMQRFEWSCDLAELLGNDVDLIDLNAAHTDVRFIIISTGRRIFSSDDYLCDTFEMTSFSMYQYLEESRREIIHEIKKRGSVYG